MAQKIDKKFLDLMMRIISIWGQIYHSLDHLQTSRAIGDEECLYLIATPTLSESFKRKVKEHRINSDILRDAMNNYRASQDGLWNDFKAEILSEDKNDDQNNLHIRPARPVAEDRVPGGFEDQQARVMRQLNELAGRRGRPAEPRNRRRDGGLQ